MFELLDVLNALSMPMKAAWLVWLAAGAGLVLWHRRAHVEVVRALPPAVRQRQRRPAPARAPASAGGTATEPPSLDTAHVA
jgi:hypothetical protein